MRITFAPEPGVEDRLRSLASLSGRSLNSVVNDLLQAALSSEPTPRPRPYFKVETFPLGLRPGFDPDRLSKEVQDLDDLEWAHKRAREEDEERARQASTRGGDSAPASSPKVEATA